MSGNKYYIFSDMFFSTNIYIVYIGLLKKSGDWIWESGNSLNISKWENSTKPHKGRLHAAISENGGLFKPVLWQNKRAYICEMHGGSKTFHTASTL